MSSTSESWSVSKHGTPDYAPQYGIHAPDCGDHAIVTGANAEHDAQLMAAAPELQQALAGLLILLEPAWDELSGLVAGGPEAVNAAADAATAALRKARGEA